MKKTLTVLLSLAMTSPLVAAAETTACFQHNKSYYDTLSCLDKRGMDLTAQRDKLYQAQIDQLQKRLRDLETLIQRQQRNQQEKLDKLHQSQIEPLQKRISDLETLIQLQQRQLDALKRAAYQLPQSCRNLHQQEPTKVSGLYSIRVDGLQGDKPLNIYCNMDLQGGGWSLVYATNANQQELKSATEVTPRSARYFPEQIVRVLAAQATEILIIDADKPSRFIKSVDKFPIQRLRALQNLNDPKELTGRTASAHWQGTEHDSTAYWCKPSSGGYPTLLYHANCNKYGLFIDNQRLSRFNYSSSNHAMSVYIR